MLRRPLNFESLEPRRMLAVIIDSIDVINVNEGSTASLNTRFVDSTPTNSYTALVQWQPGESEETGSFVSRPSGSNSSMRIRFDYRFDTSGFFTPARRALLEIAGDLAVGALTDSLGGFTSAGTNQFTASFRNPSTGAPAMIPNFSVAANEMVIFVGSDDLAGSSLAEAGAGSGGGGGTQAFLSSVTSRGQVGVPETDVAPWGGAISYDDEIDWYDNANPNGLTRSQSDFLSVTIHEIAHILGFTNSTESFARWVSNGQFTGPNATSEYDKSGSPPLAPDNSHWEEGLQDGGQEALLDPSVTNGQRKYFTALDFAAFDDLGWTLSSRRVDGQTTDTHTYPDNGNFTARLRIQDGTEQGTQTFQVNVQNVSPTLAEIGTITVRANTPLQFSTGFSDPGASDTHEAAIAWGDSPNQETINVNAATRTITGQHTYANPGTYTANLGIQDDDGGTTTQMFTVIVTPPPRGDWQNATNQFDVNNDASISPTDVNVIITELISRNFSSAETGLLPEAPANVPNFYDVTGDDIVSAQDAIQVVNRIPRASAQSANPPARIAFEPFFELSSDELGEEATDSAFSDFAMSWLSGALVE